MAQLWLPLPASLLLPTAGGLAVQLECGAASRGLTCRPAQPGNVLSCRVRATNQARARRALPSVGEEVTSLLDSWEALVPGVVGCYASLAGRDFCFYFLATYNISITPAVCNPSCALGVVKNCATLPLSFLEE